MQCLCLHVQCSERYILQHAKHSCTILWFQLNHSYCVLFVCFIFHKEDTILSKQYDVEGEMVGIYVVPQGIKTAMLWNICLPTYGMCAEWQDISWLSFFSLCYTGIHFLGCSISQVSAVLDPQYCLQCVQKWSLVTCWEGRFEANIVLYALDHANPRKCNVSVSG